MTNDRQDLVSGRTLARIGLGLLLLGIVFLYRWGVENGYIIPAARVGVGVTLSSGMLAVGWVTRTRQATFGALLQGGGVAGLFVFALAASTPAGSDPDDAAAAALAVDPHSAVFENERFPEAEQCASCHREIYNEWRSSATRTPPSRPCSTSSSRR